jgi:hypothetical protein
VKFHDINSIFLMMSEEESAGLEADLAAHGVGG